MPLKSSEIELLQRKDDWSATKERIMSCLSNVNKYLQSSNAIDEHDIFERRHQLNSKIAMNDVRTLYVIPMDVLKRTETYKMNKICKWGGVKQVSVECGWF